MGNRFTQEYIGRCGTGRLQKYGNKYSVLIRCQGLDNLEETNFLAGNIRCYWKITTSPFVMDDIL